MGTLMIYGATGYTGRMAAAHARAAGLNLVLGGRDEMRLASLATDLGAPYRVLRLDDVVLGGVDVLLNCAGPFLRTAEPLMRGAIRAGIPYLDIAAEMDSYRLAAALATEATAAGVMLLPGSGGSVAMLGCLAGRAVEGMDGPERVRIALRVAGSMSRGSAISAAENVTVECLQLVDGRLAPMAGGRAFDFGMGPVDCFPVTLPDLLTIHRATGVPNIETFVHVSGNGFPSGELSALPDGPTDEERTANRYQAAVEVTGANGHIRRATLDTVNGYSFTPLAAVEAARRVLAGEMRPGFQTPASLFGNGFAETISDTRIYIDKG